METLKQYGTFDLIAELAQRSPDELEYSIFILLVQKKIDYKQISDRYVKALEAWNKDKENQFSEACVCVLESFSRKRKNDTDFDKKAIQRALYLLNQSKQFNMKTLNEKYGYNEEEAKKLSWYEREKAQKQF